jgi:hypothetical protein
VVGDIFCELEKAFDSVDYDMLSCKLNCYGISGPIRKLIKSYVTNRYQRFLIRGTSSYRNSCSEWGKINNAVPQGSIVGPLRFLFCINNV